MTWRATSTRRYEEVLETPAEQAGSIGHLHALDDNELAELVGVYIFRPGAPDVACTGEQSEAPSDTGIRLPNARHIWPGGGGGGGGGVGGDGTHALALVYNEAEARPVTGLAGGSLRSCIRPTLIRSI